MPPASRELVPARATLKRLALAARSCHACHLFENATQTVFGEGPVPAKLMLVGEQPGDQEDRRGRVFVGPAGRVLDRALAGVGISRSDVYVTNAVKHFKWEPRGKRRMHSRPNFAELQACHGWLEAELSIVRPEVVVCMGATAAAAFFGRGFKVLAHRGHVLASPWAARVVVTYHPSALLRMMSDPDAYEIAMADLVGDLKRAASLAA